MHWLSTMIQEAQLHLAPREHRIPWKGWLAPRPCEHCPDQRTFETNTLQEETSDEHVCCNNHTGQSDSECDPQGVVRKETSFSCPGSNCDKTFKRIARLLPHFGHRMCFIWFFNSAAKQ